jgi:hypothetical protein
LSFPTGNAQSERVHIFSASGYAGTYPKDFMLAINHSRLSEVGQSTKSCILIVYFTDVYDGVI